MKTWYKEYEAIKDKAILISECDWEKMGEEEQNKLLSEKTVITPAGQGYACALYMIKGNARNLTDQQCAIFADRGNLCFGYRMEGRTIVVYTD